MIWIWHLLYVPSWLLLICSDLGFHFWCVGSFKAPARPPVKWKFYYNLYKALFSGLAYGLMNTHTSRSLGFVIMLCMSLLVIRQTCYGFITLSLSPPHSSVPEAGGIKHSRVDFVESSESRTDLGELEIHVIPMRSYLGHVAKLRGLLAQAH